jgi:hypothetical protein
MPFINCWTPQRRGLEGDTSVPLRYVPCNTQVACNVPMPQSVTDLSRFSEGWKGICSACKTEYHIIITHGQLPAAKPVALAPTVMALGKGCPATAGTLGVKCGEPAGHTGPHRTGSIGTPSLQWTDEELQHSHEADANTTSEDTNDAKGK